MLSLEEKPALRIAIVFVDLILLQIIALITFVHYIRPVIYPDAYLPVRPATVQTATPQKASDKGTTGAVKPTH